jgi:hypothetical protein
MIGVIYAPKQEQSQPTTVKETDTRDESTTTRVTQSTPAGERKMNVVRGGQSMFAKKEMQRPSGGEQVGWGTWIWNNVVGGEEKKEGAGNSGAVLAGGGGQSNVVVRALKGISETVFGF